MNFIQSTDQRFDVYRKKSSEAFDDNKKHWASYYLACLALEELKAYVEQGNEPSEEQLSEIEYRFDVASEESIEKDYLVSLRSKLLKAWMRPIVWAGIVNLEGLTDSQSANAARHMGIAEAGNDTADLVRSALTVHDEINAIPVRKRSESEKIKGWHVNGFLHETSVIQIGARHNTAKQIMLPSLAYDDALHPDRSLRIDGFYLDNRRKRGDKTVHPYQVGLPHEHTHVSPGIPIISARLTGNITRSPLWPNDDRDFATSRRLVTERRTHRLSRTASSTLDRIGSAVVGTVTRAA